MGNRFRGCSTRRVTTLKVVGNPVLSSGADVLGGDSGDSRGSGRSAATVMAADFETVWSSRRDGGEGDRAHCDIDEVRTVLTAIVVAPPHRGLARAAQHAFLSVKNAWLFRIQARLSSREGC